MMHKVALNSATHDVFEKLCDAAFLKKFYLAGGTALALHYGHRESVEDVLQLCNKKFGAGARDPYHILKALVFFEDADQQPDVVTKPAVKWGVVKKFFVGEVERMQKV